MKTSEAIKFFGSGAELAKKLGIAPQAVYQWGNEVPRLRAFEIERLTHGKLKAESPKRKAA